MVSLLLFAPAESECVELTQGQLSFPMRYDGRHDYAEGVTERSRLQYQGSFSSRFRLWGSGDQSELALGSLVGTGLRYTSQWVTVNDRGDIGRRHPIFLRQAFMIFRTGNARLELGAVPPVKGKVSETSLDKDGWIKGSRLVLDIFEETTLEFVLGDLGDFEHPNALERWSLPNYFEFELTQTLSNTFRTEAGFVTYEDDAVFRGEVRLMNYLIKGFRSEVSAEFLRTWRRGVNAYDLLVAVHYRGVKFSQELAEVPEAFGRLGGLSNDFFTFGQHWVTSLSGPLTEDGRLSWFTRNYVVGKVTNLKVGIQLKWALN